MLTDFPLRARIPVADYERAKAYYIDVLGLSPVAEHRGSAVSFAPGNAPGFALYVPRGIVKGLVGSWEVNDVAAEVAALRQRGVVFEDHREPGFPDGIFTEPTGLREAFFHDSEGNLLSVVHYPRP